jgi:hypothetical protein
MVGNEDGTVTVWSAKKGASICNLHNWTIISIDVIKAHNDDITRI